MSGFEILIAHWRELAPCGEPEEAGRATGATAVPAAVTPGGWRQLAEVQGTRC